ncbi:Aureobasidin resistance protein Aur1 [Mortierella claussenii]|nr:Aureobasidin resistance protein Aur1 [Mortierella claussenii]
MDKPVWFKLPIALAVVPFLLSKRPRAFILPFLAIAGWLILFYCCRFIPSEWRPHIYTTVLPALDHILYGGNLSALLASTTAPWKDLLAWLPYGILHFVMPIVAALLIALYAPKGTLPVFARTFGYMNMAGVLTQLLFPCAPPWYETRYGPLQPAHYSMPGDPGGLARVDDILGTEMYQTTFTASPLVFGAFPSLHSGCAWQLALFAVYVFGPRAVVLAGLYVMWIWWAALYLEHHYVVDLVGGGIYAMAAFWIGSLFLPPLTLATSLHPHKSHLQTEMGLGQTGAYCRLIRQDDNKTSVDMAHLNGLESLGDDVVLDIEDDSRSFCLLSKPDRWDGWHGYEDCILILESIRTGSRCPLTPHSFPRTVSSVFLNDHDGACS